MKPCNRICDVANDGLCIGVCTMGLDPKGYKVKHQANDVYLIHKTLENALIHFSDCETEKLERLNEFVSNIKTN